MIRTIIRRKYRRQNQSKRGEMVGHILRHVSLIKNIIEGSLDCKKSDFHYLMQKKVRHYKRN